MTRLEQIRNKRRMQRRIRQLVEERRMAQALDKGVPLDGVADPDATGEGPQAG